MSDQQFDDEIDLGELLLTVLGQWRLVVSTLLASVALSGLYAFVIAPTQYSAEVVIRSVPANFCPGIECAVSLEDVLSQSSARVATSDGFEAMDAAANLSGDSYFFGVDGPDGAVIGQRRFFEHVNASVMANTVRIVANHESDLRAVDIANAAADFVQERIALRADDALTLTETSLRIRLNNLAAPGTLTSEAWAAVAVERSLLNAQLAAIEAARLNSGPISKVDVRAALPAQYVKPRRSLIMALGAFLGLFLGVGAAIAFSVRRGSLYTPNAISAAFGVRDALSGSEKAILAQAAQGLWQQVRVAIGDAVPPVIAIAGHVPGDTLKQAALGLHAEFARSGKQAAIVDLGQWFPLQAPTSDMGEGVGLARAGDDVRAYACGAGCLTDVLACLAQAGTIAIVLPPPAEHDLPLMRDVFFSASARVFLARRGNITRKDVGRFLLAERGSQGQRVVAVV